MIKNSHFGKIDQTEKKKKMWQLNDSFPIIPDQIFLKIILDFKNHIVAYYRRKSLAFGVGHT